MALPFSATRLHLRFSLVTLFAVFVPLSIAAAYMGAACRRACNQKYIVRKILRHGGDVRYCVPESERGSIDYPEQLRKAPQILACLGGDDLLNPVKAVYLFGAEEENRETIRLLPMLTELRHVGIFNIRLGDEQFSDLANIQRLNSLTVGRYAVARVGNAPEPSFPLSDKAVVAISGMRQLELLCLSDTQLTDNHVAHFTSLSKVRIAGFARTAITDQSMHSLSKLGMLAHLDVSGCHIGDSGVNELLGAVALECLWLSCTDITDAAIETIAKRNCCTVLDVGRCRISDRAVRALAGATQLKTLILDETPITERYLPDIIDKLRSLRLLSIRGTRVDRSFATHLRLHDRFGSIIHGNGADGDVEGSGVQEVADDSFVP